MSTELCENQDEPELKCNGKCFLMKQLEAADQQESSTEDKIPTPKTNRIECTVDPTLVYELIYAFAISENEVLSKFKNDLTPGYSNPIEHPPC